MPMPKRKPNYNPTSTMQELLTAVCEYYGDPVVCGKVEMQKTANKMSENGN